MAQRDARPPFAAIDGAVPPEFSALPTPCYLLDEAALTRNAEILGGLARRTGCKVLLAQKAFSNYDLYPLLAPHLAGTEASGLFEARLGAEEMPGKEVHVFCAAYRADEMDELLRYADHIVFNSPAQLAKFGPAAKAAGKIGHIGVTAHMAAVFEKALTMDWVETVMFPYNIVETQGEALMQKCREQNVGFICMKPMAGGALEDARLAMRFIGCNENVSVVIPGMYDVREIDQNIEAIEDASPLTEAERAQLDVIRRELGTQFCRRCNYCQPCTAGIAISGIFVLEGYLNRYGLGDWAKQRYAAMGKKAGDCVGCGACEKRCPYQLPIRQMLARCKGEFGA